MSFANSDVDVIVIGLGPSGMMATLTLLQRGYRVLAVDRGKAYMYRDQQIPYDVANGFGGAGLFSDGKLSFFPSASNLYKNLNKKELRCAYEQLSILLAKTGYTIPGWQNNWTLPRRQGVVSSRIKYYKTQYFERNDCTRFVSDVFEQIHNHIILEANVVAIEKNDDGTFCVTLDRLSSPLTSNGVVFATGKAGNIILSSLLNISLATHMRYEAGIRVETDAINFRPYALKQPDYKYIEDLTDNIQFRTFCCCKDGQVIESDYLRNISFNGSIMPYRTGRANIGLTVRIENEHNDIVDEINGCITRKDKYVYAYTERYIPSKHFCYGPELDKILLDRIGLVIKSSESKYKTKIYGPEIEYCGLYPQFSWDTLKAGNNNIWIVGDLSAKYRGLIASLISGIYAANAIEREMEKTNGRSHV